LEIPERPTTHAKKKFYKLGVDACDGDGRNKVMNDVRACSKKSRAISMWTTQCPVYLSCERERIN